MKVTLAHDDVSQLANRPDCQLEAYQATILYSRSERFRQGCWVALTRDQTGAGLPTLECLSDSVDKWILSGFAAARCIPVVSHPSLAAPCSSTSPYAASLER